MISHCTVLLTKSPSRQRPHHTAPCIHLVRSTRRVIQSSPNNSHYTTNADRLLAMLMIALGDLSGPIPADIQIT